MSKKPQTEQDHPEMGGALSIFGSVRFLKKYGRADAIERAKMARDLLTQLQKGQREGRGEHYAMFMVEMTAAELDGYLDLARGEEEHLMRLGWRMDEAGKVSRIRKGRGRDFLAECVWEIHSKKYAGKKNTYTIRRKIAAELSQYFDADELDPKSGGPIYMAIYNRERRSR